MPVTKRGEQSYGDDPHQRVFRVIYPQVDDSELDGPPTDGSGKPYLKPDGTPHTWESFGTDPLRPSVVNKIPQTDHSTHLRGTPSTAADEPVVYWVNVDPILAQLTEAQQDSLQTWLAANPQWSNNFINLGVGDVATLTASLIAPCWIIVAGGGTPAIGTLQKTITFAGTTLAKWVAP